MKRVELKKKFLKKREKNLVAAKYAHMWIDLVVKGNLDHMKQSRYNSFFVNSKGKKIPLMKLSKKKDIQHRKKRRTSSLDEMGESYFDVFILLSFQKQYLIFQ